MPLQFTVSTIKVFMIINFDFKKNMSANVLKSARFDKATKFPSIKKILSKMATRVVRPLMSKEFTDARRRALGLYRAFYRYIPYIIKYFDIPKNEEDCRWKLREYFYKNSCITDVRVIDLLVIKGYIELKEITHQWQQKGHMMRHWSPSIDRQPGDFLSKFFAGAE